MQIQIVVEDNGNGIKKENVEKLFINENKLKMNHKETGIGINFSNEIINNMGGSVEVESDEEKGSKFKITLQVNSID